MARHHISPCMHHGFTYDAGYMLTPGTTIAWAELPSCVTPSLIYYPIRPTTSPHQAPEGTTDEDSKVLVSEGSIWARDSGYGNINPLSIDYACRPRLRSRLTLGGLACPRNPWSSGGGVSHPSFATHACILTRVTSTTGSRRCFTGDTTLPYPPQPLDNKSCLGTVGMPRLRRCA
jgi:hypothetical protein